MNKSFFLIIIIIIVGIIAALYMFAEEISRKLTDNLNRNLDVDWGVNHPKFNKKNLIVDFLDMSVRWDDFKIIFPKTKTSHIRNSLSGIYTYGCKSNISFLLELQIFVKCKKIGIDYYKNKWTNNGDLRISRTFFFERRVFDDFYDKLGNINVRINTKELIINNKNLGHYKVNNSFLDEQNMLVFINDEKVIFSKKHEGLILKTSGNDYFFLNRSFFENTIN